MANTSNFQLTIDFRDSNNLDDEELLEEFTQKLYTQMRDDDNLEEIKVNRIPVPVSKLPEGHKSKGDKKESGILNIELNLANIKTFITFLWERLSGKATEVEVKIDKKGSIKLKVGSQKDLSAAIQDVEKLVKSLS